MPQEYFGETSTIQRQKKGQSSRPEEQGAGRSCVFVGCGHCWLRAKESQKELSTLLLWVTLPLLPWFQPLVPEQATVLGQGLRSGDAAGMGIRLLEWLEPLGSWEEETPGLRARKPSWHVGRGTGQPSASRGGRKPALAAP